MNGGATPPQPTITPLVELFFDQGFHQPAVGVIGSDTIIYGRLDSRVLGLTSITGNNYDSISVNLVNEAGQELQIDGWIENGSSVRMIVLFSLKVNEYPPSGQVDTLAQPERLQLSGSRYAYELSSNVFGVLNYREVVPASGVFVGIGVGGPFANGVLAFRDSAGFYRLGLGPSYQHGQPAALVRQNNRSLEFYPSPAVADENFHFTGSGFEFFGTSLQYWQDGEYIAYGVGGVSICNDAAIPVPIGLQSPLVFPI